MVRTAFTLIELIFAIVVIGIAVISIPTMNQVSTDGMEANQVQEAIFLSSAELNQAVSANWDDNSYNPGDENTSSAKVINLNGDCNNDLTSIRYRRRPGHVTEALHRSCLDNPGTGLAGADNTLVLNLNDLQKNNQLVAKDDLNGYKNDMLTTIRVNPAGRLITFGRDILGDAVNIKQIEASISVNGQLAARLNTYSCNIGEVDYDIRSF